MSSTDFREEKLSINLNRKYHYGGRDGKRKIFT